MYGVCKIFLKIMVVNFEKIKVSRIDLDETKGSEGHVWYIEIQFTVNPEG